MEKNRVKQNTNIMVEATEKFQNNHSLALARTLYSFNDKCIKKIRVINPLPAVTTIKKGTVIGMAEVIREDCILFDENKDKVTEVKKTSKHSVIMDRKTRKNHNTVKNIKHNPIEDVDVPEHLRDLFKKATQDKNEKQKKILASILKDCAEAFSKNEDDLGCTHLGQHEINTGFTLPVKQRPRRIPLAFKGEEEKAIEDLKRKQVIRESTSPWASPIVMVRKSNGQARPCIDYRSLNKQTVRDSYPLPRIQDCLDAAAGAKYFSTFDLTSGYHQIPVKEEDIYKTAFITKYGLFEFVKMPFGLCNSSSTFQRIMERALKGLNWKTCLIYIDDIIVYANSFEEHMERVREVLIRIIEAKLKLKPEKCQLLCEEVEFLGHVLNKDGVKPNPKNVEKLLKIERPKNQKQVRQFIGLATYYRKYIKDFAKIAQPLHNLTHKDVKFIWSDECESAFKSLKEMLSTSDIVSYPNDEDEYILDTDASNYALGAVLSQMQNGKERVIAYGSRTLNKNEKNYCVTDKELLAVKEFVEHFRQYLLGRTFTIRTDHQALVWLLSMKEPKARTARWIEILSAYHFNIEYRAGGKHTNADSLSRCVDPRNCECLKEEDIVKTLRCGPCRKCKKKNETMGQSRRIHKDMEELSIKNPLDILFSQCWKIILYLTVLWNVTKFTLIRVRQLMGQGRETNISQRKLSRNKLSETMLNLIWKIWLYLMMSWNLVKPSIIRTVETRSRKKQNTEINSKERENSLTNSRRECWTEVFSMEKLGELQREDPDIEPVIRWLQNGVSPTSAELSMCSPATKHYYIQRNVLKITENVLIRQFVTRNGLTEYLQYVVPEKLKKEIMQHSHDNILSGHLGIKKTKEKVRRSYYWFEMREEITLYVNQCDVCARQRICNKPPRAPLGNMKVGGVMDRLSTDLMGPFPESGKGNKYILTVTDHFTRWTEIFAVPDQTAETCASVILNEVIARFGCPYEIHSDQGRNYESKIFKELCKMLEVRKTRTTARNPQGNGMSEVYNKTLIKMIKSYLKNEQSNWDVNLGCLAGAYRATQHESTGLTPNMLMLGREVKMPVELKYGNLTGNIEETENNLSEYAIKLRERLAASHTLARKYLSKTAKRQKDNYDHKINTNTYKPGDLVWCKIGHRREGNCPKLNPKFEGPGIIVESLSPLCHKVVINNKKTLVINHNKMMPYRGNKPPKWTILKRQSILNDTTQTL